MSFFLKKDGSQPPTLREFALATVNEEEPLTQSLVEPVVFTPLPAVTHPCRVRRLWPRRVLERYPRQLRHPIHHSPFDYMDAIWIALGRDSKLRAQISLPTMNPVTTLKYHGIYNTVLKVTTRRGHFDQTPLDSWPHLAKNLNLDFLLV